MVARALVLSSLAASALAAQAQTSLNLFIDGSDMEKFDGSIVAANCDATTIALRCTSGTYGSGVLQGTCDPSATVMATYGPSSYEVSTAATVDGTAAILSETCSLDGTTQAVCSASISVSLPGTSTATHSQITLSDINFYQVPITAGASKLPASTSCTNENAAAPTGVTDIYKVLVVPAAVVAAGAFA